jgi:hypothetical protein
MSRSREDRLAALGDRIVLVMVAVLVVLALVMILLGAGAYLDDDSHVVLVQEPIEEGSEGPRGARSWL